MARLMIPARGATVVKLFWWIRRSCAVPVRYDRSTDELGGRSSVPRRRNLASALAWKERCTFSEPELSNKRCQRSVFVIGARGWKYRRRGGALRLQRRPPRACGRMDEARRDRRARARGAPGTSVLLRGLKIFAPHGESAKGSPHRGAPTEGKRKSGRVSRGRLSYRSREFR